jgi:hypothetical protein
MAPPYQVLITIAAKNYSVGKMVSLSEWVAISAPSAQRIARDRTAIAA